MADDVRRRVVIGRSGCGSTPVTGRGVRFTEPALGTPLTAAPRIPRRLTLRYVQVANAAPTRIPTTHPGA